MSSFRWGGKTWRAGNRKAFVKHLKSRGMRYEDWAAQHPDEARETFRWSDPIDARIQSTLGPEIASIRGEREDRREYHKQLQERQKYVTQQLAEMLKSVAPSVQNLYGQARDASAALGKGFAGETGDILSAQAANDNSFLQSVVGAPQGQLDARTATAGGAGLENSVYGLGFSPAQLMNEAGAAWGAQSAQLPYYASQRGASSLAEMLKAASDEDRKFGSDIRTLQSKRPGLRLELEDARRKDIEDRRRYNIGLKRQAEADRRSQLALEAQIAAINSRLAGTTGTTPTGEPDDKHHKDPKSGLIVENGWHHEKQGGEWVPVENKDPKDPKEKPGAKAHREAVKERGKAYESAVEGIHSDAEDLAKKTTTFDPRSPTGEKVTQKPRSQVRKALIGKYFKMLSHFAGKNGKGALRRWVTKAVDEALDLYY
jgi:hypothetical protein